MEMKMEKGGREKGKESKAHIFMLPHHPSYQVQRLIIYLQGITFFFISIHV